MNDRELLELAAKAAGLNSHRYYEAWRGMAAYTLQDGYYGPTWNPLTDDGDALRLAVKLGMSLDTALGQSLAIALNGKDCLEPHNGDPYAATRRAIVRAAAEIGRGMSS